MKRGAQILGYQVAAASTFQTVAPNIAWPSEWNLFHFNQLAPRIRDP